MLRFDTLKICYSPLCVNKELHTDREQHMLSFGVMMNAKFLFWSPPTPGKNICLLSCKTFPFVAVWTCIYVSSSKLFRCYLLLEPGNNLAFLVFFAQVLCCYFRSVDLCDSPARAALIGLEPSITASSGQLHLLSLFIVTEPLVS